jgi:hypothetical protein
LMSITITWQPAMITADHFQTSNHPSKEPQLCPPAIRHHTHQAPVGDVQQ